MPFCVNRLIGVPNKGALNGSIGLIAEIPESLNDLMVEFVFLKERLPDGELVIVIEDELLDFIRCEPDALVEVDLHKDAHVVRDLGDLH
jgi:hypothetical protein